MEKEVTEKQKAKMRVKIAQDVLDSLKLMKPSEDVYVEAVSIHGKEGQILLAAKTDKKRAAILQKHCEVCALGACFLSAVKLYNEQLIPVYAVSASVVMFDGLAANIVKPRLREFFTTTQMDMIESAFEGYVITYQSSGALYSRCNIAADWGRLYTTDKGRMRAIMQNIVKNGGEFKLPGFAGLEERGQ